MLHKIAVFTFVGTAVAHGGVTGFDINGKSIAGFKSYNNPQGQITAQRPWGTFDPIQDPMSPKMVCNNPGTPQSSTVDVPAGAKVTAKWNDYTHEYGPIVIWMTECPGNKCSTWDGQGGKWFKIDERGLVSGTVAKGVWGSGEMIKNGKKWDFTIPKALKSGQYLLRTETIAMHSTPAQWYPQCLQINVTGGGSATPPAASRASIPGVYKTTDKIWAQPIYSRTSETSVTIPGPAVWGGGTAGRKSSATSPAASRPAVGKSRTSGFNPASFGAAKASGASSAPKLDDDAAAKVANKEAVKPYAASAALIVSSDSDDMTEPFDLGSDALSQAAATKQDASQGNKPATAAGNNDGTNGRPAGSVSVPAASTSKSSRPRPLSGGQVGQGGQQDIAALIKSLVQSLQGGR